MQNHKDHISIEIGKARSKLAVPKLGKRQFRIAIVGASGIVGRELLSILAERNFPVSSIKALTSINSAGEKIDFGEGTVTTEELNSHSFKDIDIAFFAVSTALAKEYCPIAAKAGAVCIDKSSAHRADPDIPLVVPEVNPHDIAHFAKKHIIASPNCTATPLVQVLAPLYKISPIKRVVVSSYQAVSGAGKGGIEELDRQTRDLFNMREVESTVFNNRIAFNVLPCIPASDAWLEDGSTDEESKVVSESRRILGLPDLRITATCVRVPVFNGHSESVNIEFENAITHEQARDALSVAPGVVVIDDRASRLYPTPTDASGEDVTLVGRIRVDASVKHGLSLWLSSDNLRTGAALNAVRIAEILCSEYLK